MFNYICGVLLILLVACGGFAYYEHGQIQKLYQDVATYKLSSEQNLKAKEDADASCLITVKTLNEYYDKQSHLESSQNGTGDAINTLPTLTIKEKANAAPTASQKPSAFADDDRLSPDTMRLLDQAYCYGDKDGCAATPK